MIITVRAGCAHVLINESLKATSVIECARVRHQRRGGGNRLLNTARAGVRLYVLCARPGRYGGVIMA